MSSYELSENLEHEEVFIIDDAREYARVLEEAGGGAAKDEGLLALMPALYTERGIYIYRPAYSRIEGFDEDFLRLIIEHERVERELERKGKRSDAVDTQYLESLGINEKHPGTRDADDASFFHAIHAYALEREIEEVMRIGKADEYLRYLEEYQRFARKKFDTGEWHEDEELVQEILERQNIRIRLLKRKISGQ